MEYKGYTGSIHYHNDESIYYGSVLGIRSLISYEGSTIPELFADFKASVNSYLELCEAHGWEPEKPHICRDVRHTPDGNSFCYMDHTGTIEYDDHCRMYHGKLDDIQGICAYSGIDLEHLKEDFQKAVDEYNDTMDYLYFELMVPDSSGIHKLLTDWFENQDNDNSVSNPFVFRDANMLRRDEKKIYTVEEIRELLLPVFTRFPVKEAYLLGDYCSGTADGSSSVELLCDCKDLDLLSYLHELSTTLAKNVVLNYPKQSEWYRLDSEPSILLYRRNED